MLLHRWMHLKICLMGSQVNSQKKNKSNLLKKMNNQLRNKQRVVVVRREELMRALKVKKSGEEAATIGATIKEGKRMVRVVLNGLQKLSQAKSKQKFSLMLRKKRNRKRKSNSSLKSKKKLNLKNRISRKRLKKLLILKAQRKKRNLKKRKKRKSSQLNQRRMHKRILHNLKCQTWLK